MRTLERADLAIRRHVTLGDLMERLARVHEDRILVTQSDPELSLTYRQAAKRVSRWAGGISKRIAPGDRVVIATPNTYEFFLLCCAASRAGGTIVPVNPLMRPEECDHVVADCDATLVIHSAHDVDDAACLEEPVGAEPDDVAALFYTSGTTGLPKGARLTHRALIGSATPLALWPSGLRRDEAVASLPLAHIMGFAVVTMLATAGIPVHHLPRFRPLDVLDALERRRSSIFVGVPAMYRMLLEAGAADRDLSGVRLWASGADAMPEDLALQFKQFGATLTLPLVHTSLGQAAFAEGYGMVEVGGGVAAKISPPFLHLPTDQFLGISLPGYQMRVVDDDGEVVDRGEIGELWVKGPGVLRGYHGDDERSAETVTIDGWLRTGDLARRGPLGMVSFAGRQKDVILHGGYTIVAVEVEHKLEEHPDIIEACVVGLPDDRLGEVPAAAVRFAEGATTTTGDVIAWAADHLAEYKRPTKVIVVDDLPRTGTRKVHKREVRSLFSS